MNAHNWVSLTDNELSGSFLLCHAIYTEESAERVIQHKYRGLLMIRDPRDQAISWAYFASPLIFPRLRLPFNDKLSLWVSDTSTIYSPMPGKQADGWGNPLIKSFGDLDNFYCRYLPWADHPSFIVIKFEKLVGPKGGGTEQEQFNEIKKIALHIGVDVDDAQIKYVASNLFGAKDGTFRKGQIGSWKEHFTPDHKKLFKNIIGNLLIDLQYEQDLNW